ncbi:NTF2 fold immunity protein [Flavobacterium ardleyense]|uniref:NTF2 fold immunity protein n=1 Tax=Flavobacterium ardleyense TaxID=2038737 RepID=UPI00298CFBFA|nr:NTF2 fold immunity protein [Flavobacterium ardleyense]
MKTLKCLSIILILLSTFSIAAQSNNNNSEQKLRATMELKYALSNQVQHNLIDDKRLIIKDSLTAIAVAETMLFELYSKKSIEKQKPYEIFLIDNHWIINGTLPTNKDGGTFLIIIDARNSKVIKITHGK